ncbi:sensor histidine kinase KdpD [Synechococcus sp. CS-1332]|uniref:sensor histidine kinase n=1 Tax=Synechococcus sp. CS-1332 TaxID=2847972 RepID=UPI00223B988E|nr:HAMP domain-containing sensor histidine kinase [Synechococcus sp. CS-1332]MCT0207773.1 HAMP domain-containing histidine kinase [Synechococcus sp. CS-1332]
MGPLRPASQAFSIRRRLLGLSLLAVLGGYALLIVATALLASQERRSQHRATAASVRRVLLARKPVPHTFEAISTTMAQLISPNFLGWVETDQGVPFGAADQIRLFSIPTGLPLTRLPGLKRGSEQVAVVRAGEFTYLTSSQQIQLGARTVRLRFLEDITQKLAQQRLLLILLSAAAGVATLFTGLLLRPVLVRGLSPLHDLGLRMQAISSDSLDSQRVLVASQPKELVPIALAFNDLLDRLSASWERQRGFANGVSHELRTPISLIRNYASSLRRRSHDLSDQQAEQLALIEEEAGRMGRLVADLLALTRIEAHRTLMPYEPFDVAQAIERVAERLRSRCYGRLRICPGATQSARTFALGEADRFEQCLANLIENAQKYDPGAGPIQLRLDASLDRVVVHVIDSGPGVPDNEKALIFERFGRGRQTHAIPGSGVGLAVVRALMEAMGGSVSVADGPEGGADFQLRLKGAAPLLGA